MRDANFFAVFVGIESPDEETLKQMRKKQNTRRDIPESIHRIYAHGMFVLAGFIVGFDAEKGSVARPMAELVQDCSIPIAMVGLLYALHHTQLGPPPRRRKGASTRAATCSTRPAAATTAPPA